MEDFILRVKEKNKLDYKCCLFVDSDFKIENHDGRYDIIEIDNAKNIFDVLRTSSNKSVIDCMFNLDLTKLVLIDMGATNDKGFWTWLDDCLSGSKDLKAIPVIVRVLEVDLIPDIFVKKCNILIESNELPDMNKLKINKNNIHLYKKFLLNLSYMKANVKSHDKVEEIMFNQKRKYL